MNKIEKIIKGVVSKNFPSADSALLKSTNTYGQVPGNREVTSHNVREVGDGSGRQYFMWGISKWSDGDIVGE